MNLGLIASVVLATQAAAPTAVEAEVRSTDAGYEQLAAGKTEAAIAHLETALERSPGDPVLLINLGAAYARAGRTDEARAMYRSAAAGERYRVELADGSWVDSRQAALRALGNLDSSTAFASK